MCAAMAAQRNGDARYALELLTFAADIAIRSKEEKVMEEHVRAAQDEVENRIHKTEHKKVKKFYYMLL